MKEKKANKVFTWIKRGLYVVVAAVFLFIMFSVGNETPESDSEQGRLLKVVKQSGPVYDIAVESYVPVEDRIACYSQVYVDNPDSPYGSGRLDEFVGEEHIMQENQTWYRVGAMEELKYLISKDETGILSLWEFVGFLVLENYVEEFQEQWKTEYPNMSFSEYTYGDVYRIIYHVESEDEIAKITTSPSTSNNTDFGKEIQEKVGTHDYTEREEVSLFYECTTDVICHGTYSDWESIHLDSDKYTYSFSTASKDKLDSGEETWGTRYITVTLNSGTTIDSWKYSALNGQFYEFRGIATTPLDENRVYDLNKLFGIE